MAKIPIAFDRRHLLGAFLGLAATTTFGENETAAATVTDTAVGFCDFT
jgi:hypothetical protein